MTTIDFSKFHGLVPAVVQDAATRDVLMVGFMNQEAWDVTRRTGFVTFFSRTRNTLWTKGETSGNKLQVGRICIDCDEDTILVEATCLGDGMVCHTGARTCFRELPVEAADAPPAEPSGQSPGSGAVSSGTASGTVFGTVRS
jgi:phosphoribosyl-AMP cyclohydrolase